MFATSSSEGAGLEDFTLWIVVDRIGTNSEKDVVVGGSAGIGGVSNGSSTSAVLAAVVAGGDETSTGVAAGEVGNEDGPAGCNKTSLLPGCAVVDQLDQVDQVEPSGVLADWLGIYSDEDEVTSGIEASSPNEDGVTGGFKTSALLADAVAGGDKFSALIAAGEVCNEDGLVGCNKISALPVFVPVLVLWVIDPVECSSVLSSPAIPCCIALTIPPISLAALVAVVGLVSTLLGCAL